MEDEYTLDKLLALRRQLVGVVGEERANEWIRDRFNSRVTYGLPEKVGADGKKKYTGYGKTTNLDVRPERFIPTGSKATLVPNKDWKSAAEGEYSILGGVRMPESSRRSSLPSEHVLTHELAHNSELLGAAANRSNVRPQDEGMFKQILEQMNKIESGAFTKRQDTGEVVAEVKDYESRLPAWKRLQSTDFFKSLPNEVKAMLLRRLNPLPAGIDAMVGDEY